MRSSLSMKPGDLVTLRKINLTTKRPFYNVAVYETPAGLDHWYWTQGEVGLFLEEEDPVNCDTHVEMVRVIHGGRVGWVYTEFLRTVEGERR